MEISKAQKAWDKLPEPFKSRLLSNIWCDTCCCFSAVDSSTCKIVDKDLVVCGNCRSCGHEISRPIQPIDN